MTNIRYARTTLRLFQAWVAAGCEDLFLLSTSMIIEAKSHSFSETIVCRKKFQIQLHPESVWSGLWGSRFAAFFVTGGVVTILTIVTVVRVVTVWSPLKYQFYFKPGIYVWWKHLLISTVSQSVMSGQSGQPVFKLLSVVP